MMRVAPFLHRPLRIPALTDLARSSFLRPLKRDVDGFSAITMHCSASIIDQ
jgi:hypothetical protein